MGAGLVNIDVGSILNGLGNVGKLFKDIRAAITGKEITDPMKLAELAAKMDEAEALLLSTQNEINKLEAAHKSIFVAGWRPFVGWICGTAFGLHFLVFPIVVVVLRVTQKEFTLPTFDIQTLTTVLFGMLGLGLYRTLEKKWKVQDLH